jgi:hypothetical protein
MTSHEKLKSRLKHRPTDAQVFTTGAQLIPMKLANGKYAWVVSCFEDETFYDGTYVAVSENWTDNIEELAGEEADDE